MNSVAKIQAAYFSGEITLSRAEVNLNILGYNPRKRKQILASMRRGLMARKKASRRAIKETR